MPIPRPSKLADPGWTPGLRDLDGLLDVLAEEAEDHARDAERAILRIEARQRARVVEACVARVTAATRPARGRLTRLLGRLADGEGGADGVERAAAQGAQAWLLEAALDDDPKTRRAAARALAKLPRTQDAAQALADAWDRFEGEDDRKAIGEALARVGGEEARARVTSPKGRVILERDEQRAAGGHIDVTRSLEGPMVVRFHSRAGLEEVVAAELGDGWRPRVAGPGVIDARLDGPLSLATRVRTATRVGFPIDPITIEEDDLAGTIARAVTSPRALRVLTTFTAGAPPRFRLAFTPPAKPRRRALVWRVAELVRAAGAGIVNDPAASTWEVVVDDASPPFVSIELVPRHADERFAWRKDTVSASSHPTIAAALARLSIEGRARGDVEREVVWDPFAGAGAELVERALVAPHAALFGSDASEDALAAARANLARAGVTATLACADATAYEPPSERPVDLIVTNPPMGRRLERGRHGDLLERFVAHAAKVLAPGGRLVWLVPEPRRVYERAEREGLVLQRSFTVDMGGFPAALSIHEKGDHLSRPPR